MAAKKKAAPPTPSPSEPKKIGLFDLIDDLSFGKQGLFYESDEAQKTYSIFMVNLMLSQHADCILHINELNKRPYISKRFHHDYLMRVLSKRKRFAKLAKPVKDEDVSVIQEIFGYSKEKAMRVRELFTTEQIKRMHESRFTGGFTKKRGN